jgi:hypothetical protein
MQWFGWAGCASERALDSARPPAGSRLWVGKAAASKADARQEQDRFLKCPQGGRALWGGDALKAFHLELRFASLPTSHLAETRAGLYECAHPGGYKLESGVLRPFPRRAATMVVTDLDGTMVGDGPAFDEGTLQVSACWVTLRAR